MVERRHEILSVGQIVPQVSERSVDVIEEELLRKGREGFVDSVLGKLEKTKNFTLLRLFEDMKKYSSNARFQDYVLFGTFTAALIMEELKKRRMYIPRVTATTFGKLNSDISGFEDESVKAGLSLKAQDEAQVELNINNPNLAQALRFLRSHSIPKFTHDSKDRETNAYAGALDAYRGFRNQLHNGALARMWRVKIT